MPQVGRAIVKERARRLRQKGAAALARHLDAEVGTTRRVLVESRDSGRTEHFTQVRLNAPIVPGVIVEVALVGHDGRQLIAA
jgi:threonylcarbamoyladenosine tRNA methylthiotransferase MtaB